MNTRSITTLVLLCLLMVSCGRPAQMNNAGSENASGAAFKVWAWMGADPEKSNDQYAGEFEKLSAHGIDAVLINTNADAALLNRISPIAVEKGLEVHAWLMAMNRPGDAVALQHPDWYAVNRNGESCFDSRPYVDYYQWLCPTRKESRDHVLQLVRDLSTVEGVSSVHLDYIRYSDIFLPIGLLPKYDLEQPWELPEFDYCYCEVCVNTFKNEHHKDPLQMDDPALDLEWRQFRLNRVKDVVDEAYEVAHARGKDLTAAVFPYPEMAAKMVRQRWDKWKIDAVLPMVYHNFYNEELDWIGYATAQGVADLNFREVELHTGIFIPSLTGDQLAEAIGQAKKGGASGVALFDAGALKEEHFKVLKELIK